MRDINLRDHINRSANYIYNFNQTPNPEKRGSGDGGNPPALSLLMFISFAITLFTSILKAVDRDTFEISGVNILPAIIIGGAMLVFIIAIIQYFAKASNGLRIIAFILLIPFAVFIVQIVAGYYKNFNADTDTVENKDILEVGKVINYGTYPQDANSTVRSIKWRVLFVDKQNTKALLLSDMILDYIPFDYREKDNGQTNVWEASPLKTWLNSKFIEVAFNNDLSHLVKDVSANAYIFLPSIAYLNSYMNTITTVQWINGEVKKINYDLMCYATGYAQTRISISQAAKRGKTLREDILDNKSQHTFESCAYPLSDAMPSKNGFMRIAGVDSLGNFSESGFIPDDEYYGIRVMIWYKYR